MYLYLFDMIIISITFREKTEHEKHLRQLEEEMELQMQKVEERVRAQVRVQRSTRAYYIFMQQKHTSPCSNNIPKVNKKL